MLDRFAGLLHVSTAVAAVMLVISFVMLLVINVLQAWNARRYGRNV